MKIRRAAIACVLTFSIIITLSGSLIGIVLAQDTYGQQITNGATNIDPAKPKLFSWSAFTNATKYEFALAKDAAMTRIIIVADVTAPNYEYNGILDYGTKYFWRIRALEPVPNDWSATFSFSTETAPPPGVLNVPNAPPFYVVQLLAPGHGSVGLSIHSVPFSWSAFKDTTKYKFVLAKDAAMTKTVIEAEVPSTVFTYKGTLNYNTVYFWHVMAIEPVPCDWSAIFAFQTEAKPVPRTTGISCARASTGSPSSSSDISPLLLGAVLLGLVFASRQRPSK